MSNNIYPDFTSSQFDVKYSRRLLLLSDVVNSHSNLSDAGNDDIVPIIVDNPDEVGDIPGIDSVLAVGQVLTASRTIDVDLFNLNILNLPEEIEDKILYYDAVTGKLSYGAVPSGRFGVSGEDDTATDDRDFSFANLSFNLWSGVIDENSSLYMEETEATLTRATKDGIITSSAEVGVKDIDGKPTAFLRTSYNTTPLLTGIHVTHQSIQLLGLSEVTKPHILYYDSTTNKLSYGATPSGGSVGSLQAVTDIGNITTNDVIVNGLTANTAINWESGTGDTIGILGATSVGLENYGAIQLANTANAFQAQIYTDILTATRQIQFPNADGVITLNQNPNYAAGTQTNGFVITLVAGIPTWQAATGGTNIYNTDGSLTGNRVLTNNGFELQFTRSGGGNTLKALSTSGRSIHAETGSGEAIYGLSGSTVAVARLQKHNTIYNSDEPVLDLIKGSSITVENGIGSRIDWYVQSLTGLVNMCKTIVRCTDVTAGSEDSDYEIHLQKNNSLSKKYTLSGKGWMLLEAISATDASALTATDGMLINVGTTNGTFTITGYWARESGVWVKL
jgi:hypothetical protein